ncbi:LysR family transcriptional regulator [Luteibacter sp. 3190]|uniref:LysR family transcriptional regulator n=1 Tax=Luteibacter sp. 3190 TaxID=2817736 RepID=UPI00285A2A80|nr:LysR family transcriptional regulator [Luteibacter sp. 3190]MDR6936660.1 LysR family hca operon transcriptional activator [Luteibacter sp. 3190]
MELRHLRYFVAVAEEGSLTVAAEKRLFTAQPSLSRQLRDLEHEVGTALFIRGARGVELTAAGRAFLDHARLSLSQAKEAIEAARRAARPPRETFAVGFLTGQEADWLPNVTRVLREHLPAIEFKVVSLYSPDVGNAIQSGEIDLGFSRIEPRPDVSYRVIAKEPLVVILPSSHRLAAQPVIRPKDLEGEAFIGFSDIPHVLRDVVDGYLQSSGVNLVPSHHIDNFAVGISLVASTGGVALLPAYVEPLLPWSVVSRPLAGTVPTIDLAVGYREDNPSPVLKTFLSCIDQVIEAGPAGQRSHALAGGTGKAPRRRAGS